MSTIEELKSQGQQVAKGDMGRFVNIVVDVVVGLNESVHRLQQEVDLLKRRESEKNKQQQQPGLSIG